MYLILVVVAITTLIIIFQRKMIYFPDRSPAIPCLATTAPGKAHFVRAGDGAKLQCWYLPPGKPDAPVVLYLQGNAGHLGYRAARVHRFAELGWGALLVGYRGFGGNPGNPCERVLYRDACACLDEIGKLSPKSPVVIWGESLGSGLGARIAATTRQRLALLVLEAPFTSLADVARHAYPFLRPLLPFLRDRYPSARLIGHIACPLFVLAGRYDRVVPPVLTQSLFDAAPAPKQLLWLEAGHEGLGTPQAFHAVAAFFDRVTGNPA